MAIKRLEKMNLGQYNFLTEKEKGLKIDFTCEKIKALLMNHTLFLSNTNVFINYIANLNTFNIHIDKKVFYTSSIQSITHYIEKEFYSLNKF